MPHRFNIMGTLKSMCGTHIRPRIVARYMGQLPLTFSSHLGNCDTLGRETASRV